MTIVLLLNQYFIAVVGIVEYYRRRGGIGNSQYIMDVSLGETNMATIHLTGRITDEGELVFEAPTNLPAGEVEITIQIGEHQFREQGSTTDDEQDFTDEEIKELLTFTPKSGKEVVELGLTGGWKDMGITDPVAWVEEQRRKEEEDKRW
ncbi:MAG: hypothetical protein ABI700_22335 [Chloroflexota bacterium]